MTRPTKRFGTDLTTYKDSITMKKKRKSAVLERKTISDKVDRCIREMLSDLPSYEFEMLKFAILRELDKL